MADTAHRNESSALVVENGAPGDRAGRGQTTPRGHGHDGAHAGHGGHGGHVSRRYMLAPAAYDEAALPSLKLARSSRLARVVARLLFWTLLVALMLSAFAPWQQSISGSGNVVAFSPDERQQSIESPIKGRAAKWGDNIHENARVSKGDLIVEIQDIDEEYLGRLESQLTAGQSQVSAANIAWEASQRNIEANKLVLQSLEAQLATYTTVKGEIVAAAQAAVDAAKNKLDAEKQALEENKATLTQVQADYDRQKTLYEERIASQLKYQDAERKLNETKAKVAKADAYVAAANNAVTEKEKEREAKSQKAQVDIDYASAALRKAKADVAKAESEAAKAQTELNKAEKDLFDTQTKVARQRNQRVEAPFDGYLTQIMPNQGSQILKEGDTICVIVPDTTDRAVQLWLKGNDAPLVEPGRHVRLQFEGWPAVQFTGWPSVAVGTFGGQVVSVDATDNGKGQFRVLVRPDPTDKPWPEGRFLRQGVRANGWVLLENVSLWFEIWRNINGFPPALSDGDKEKDPKPPKLPKP